MLRTLSAFAIVLALAGALGSAFVAPASAAPGAGWHECTLDDGYNRTRPCSGADGS